MSDRLISAIVNVTPYFNNSYAPAGWSGISPFPPCVPPVPHPYLLVVCPVLAAFSNSH